MKGTPYKLWLAHAIIVIFTPTYPRDSTCVLQYNVGPHHLTIIVGIWNKKDWVQRYTYIQSYEY